MSGAHTPGKIWVNAEKSAIVHAEDGRIACRPNHMQRWAWPENSRRLVACWNACNGISTENLEDNEPVKMLAEKYNALTSERDALLEALLRCRFDSLNMSLADLAFCRAAIAKATGGQS